MSALPLAVEDRVRALIVATLPPGADPGGVIFGLEGQLDSLGLVSFLADLEYRLAQEFGGAYLIASEQAMSRSRSPFRDVPSLTAHVTELLKQ
jgi:hypothetical protein